MLDKTDILIEANNLIHGERQGAYGHPVDDYKTTGRIIAALTEKWLKVHHGIDIEVPDMPPWLCVLIMGAAVKASRLVETPQHEDSWRDMAGYAGCGHLITGGNTTTWYIK